MLWNAFSNRKSASRHRLRSGGKLQGFVTGWELDHKRWVRLARGTSAFLSYSAPDAIRQGDILELTDSLSRNPKLLSHFFEGLRFATGQLEPLEDILGSRSSSTSSKARWSV